MTPFRENLLTKAIRLLGFENPTVIRFAQRLESYPETPEANEMLQEFYKSLLDEVALIMGE